MKSKFFILSFWSLLMVSCQKQQIQRIEFVKDGQPKNLEIRGMREEDGYLEADETLFLRAEKAIYGNEIFVKMKLSVNDLEGAITITVGDNTFAIINEPDKKALVLQGPAIGKSVNLGEMSNFIEPDVPFELTISYKDKKLSYKIDDEEIYSQKSNISPAGLIQIEDDGGHFRVYDIFCKGLFQPVEEFYTKEFLLDRAHKSVAKAADKVKDDPNRPAFHFQPPANWNNDPNGLLFYDGYYHLFYQHNPYGDRWDWMHWGHGRSKDLVHWEHLPIALWPSVEKGENHCFSGSGFIKDDGSPILFYTSIGHENPEHWAALPLDNKLKQWEKHPGNPIVVMEDHGEQFIDDWRDPFLFREGSDTYMVIGGHPRDMKGSIMMYKALNSDLTKWDYLGTPFTGEEGNWECPNFFKVGDKYVLIYSPHGKVEYYTGTMDFSKVKFKPEYHGIIDNGSEWKYYAPNTLQKNDGRRILFGWIPEFTENQGWQGAISLPRDLSIDRKGRLVQKPVSELTKLRGELVSERNVKLTNSSKKLEINYPQFELIMNIANEGANEIGFRFNGESGKPYEIELTPEALFFGEEKVVVDPKLDEKVQTVHFFFDRTVIEFFLNNGLLCATKVMYPDKANLNFEIFSKGGEVILESIDVWKINSIW